MRIALLPGKTSKSHEKSHPRIPKLWKSPSRASRWRSRGPPGDSKALPGSQEGTSGAPLGAFWAPLGLPFEHLGAAFSGKIGDLEPFLTENHALKVEEDQKWSEKSILKNHQKTLTFPRFFKVFQWSEVCIFQFFQWKLKEIDWNRCHHSFFPYFSIKKHTSGSNRSQKWLLWWF